METYSSSLTMTLNMYAIAIQELLEKEVEQENNWYVLPPPP